MALAALLLVVGCGSSTPSAASISPSPIPATSPSAPTQTTRTLTFNLVACTGPTACANADSLMEGPSRFGQGTVQIDIKGDTYTISQDAPDRSRSSISHAWSSMWYALCRITNWTVHVRAGAPRAL
jgi:hypothetical protein